jgi:hypothetical protein
MLVRIAELIEIEQFGRQRFAAGVTLTLVLVDVDFQFSGHFSRPSVAGWRCQRGLLPHVSY